MLTPSKTCNLASARVMRHAWQLLFAASLFMAFAVIGNAQTIVHGNPGGRDRWVRTGIRVENGTLITVSATGIVNVGPRGSFGPEGTTAFPDDRSIRSPSFPGDVVHLYGLVVRLTSSPTNSEDELHEDYAYGASRTICSRASGWLWLAVNDNLPSDNSGEFRVDIALSSCRPSDPRVRATRIHVSSDANINQVGAEVYVNERSVGLTGSDGMLVLPELPSGSRLMARLRIFENPTYRANHRTGSTRDWNFRVYQTSVAVNADGSLTSHVITDPTATQELRVTRSNSLVGLHIVASVEWDASRAELQRLRDEQLIPMSQFLYNATDGQFFVEQWDLVDDAGYWDDTDFRIFADLEIRPHVNLRTGGFLHSGLGTWANMRRDPGTTDSWSSPITYAHEFGHYGFDLNDEYADGRSEVFCATNLRGSGDFGSRRARASCMMYSQFVAGKLCSGHAENRHRNGTSQGDENCWLHLGGQYRDTRSGFINSWQIGTPDSRGAIVGTLPSLPAEWQPRVNIENRSRANLCEPFTIVVTNRDTGAPLDNVAVWLRTSYGQNILQGVSGSYETGGGRRSFGGGVLPLTGIHVGDRITAGGGVYVVTSADCGATSRLDSGSMKFLTVAGTTAPLFSHATGKDAIEATQERSVRMPFAPEPFTLTASVEPTAKAGQVRIRVRASDQLKTPPELRISLTGSTNAQNVAMSLDQDGTSYTGTTTLPANTKASFEVNAINQKSQSVTQFFSLALSPLNPNANSQLFSSNGQLSLTVPKGALPATAVVAIGPSTAPPLTQEPGVMVVSGPFSVIASEAAQMREPGVVRFQLPSRLGARAVDGFDSKSFEIWRYSTANKGWERLGGTLLEDVDVISTTTDQLGDYAVTARLSSGVAGGGSGPKPDPKPSPKPAEVFAVIDADLKPEQVENFGQCPVTVKFTGYITTNGPGTVKYTFTRNDGATAPVFTLDFDAAGTKTVNTSWMLGGPGLMEYSGWQRLKILSPNEMESSLEKGSFKMACK